MRGTGLVWKSHLTKFVEFGKQHAKVCGFFMSRALPEEAQDALVWNSISYVTKCVILEAARQSVRNFESCVTKCLNF